MSNPDFHVIGMGNILYRDEGIGVYAANYLRRAYRFTPAIEVEDGAMMGFGLMDYVRPARPGPRLLILDALLANDLPGAIYRLSGDQLLNLGPAMRPTAHEVDPIHLLKLATGLGMPLEMTLLGIVPANTTDLALGLTEDLRSAFPRFVDAAAAELRRHGIDAEQVSLPSLDDVIGGLVTCQR